MSNDAALPRTGLGRFVLIALGIHLCFIACYLAKSKGFAFVDIGSDTFFQFYPLQMAISHQLHELGQITWSFELGLGGFLGSLVDPLLFLFGWLPDSLQLAARLPMFSLRSILGGAFFFGFLRFIGFRPGLAVMGGLAYAFSSYAMINAQWEILHGTEFVQFSAFLFLLELYLRSGNRWAAIGAGIVVGLGNALGLYMFALFTLVYGTVRILATRGALLRAFFFFGVWFVMGLALVAPLLLPAVYYLLESPRVSGDHSQLHNMLSMVFSLNDRITIASELAGLLSKDLLNVGQNFAGWGNYFEAPTFYIGLLPLLCIPQLLAPAATRRERWITAISLLGIAAYFIIPAMRYAVYGFGHIAFRFSTVWISALLLILGLAGLRRAIMSGWWRLGLAIGAAGILVIAVSALISIPHAVNIVHVLKVIAFTAAYVALAIVIDQNRVESAPAITLFSIVFVCELLLFAIPGVIERSAVNRDGSSEFGRYDDNTIQALAFIRAQDHDGAFYRIEKTYASVFSDDSLIQRYSGTQSYYFHGSSITRFVDRMGLPRPVPSANYIGSMIARRDILDVLAVKYVISRDRSPDNWRDMQFVKTVAGLNVYRNLTAHSFGSFYNDFTSETEADALPLPQRDSLLLTHAVLQDIADVASMKKQLPPADNISSVETHTQFQKLKDNALSAVVSRPSASLLVIPMPFDKGWSATLDEQPLSLLRVDYGLTGAIVPAGKHVLALSYAPPGRALGWWLAASTVVIIALAHLMRSRANRPRLDGRHIASPSVV